MLKQRLLLFSFIFSLSVVAQNTNKTEVLDQITIESVRTRKDIKQLDSVQGTYIFSGKKSEVIDFSQKEVAYSEKQGRQIFAKVPGVFVYDMDGTGNQMNISTRGLDPHRGWEFNIRKDGILTNTDMYGYPASHYNIPMEAVDRIELVRGTGSLQYGAQFGGMLNYVTRLPDTSRILAFQSINTIGSYGLVSSYNSASGTAGKFQYYAWAVKRWNGGYRENSDSQYDAEGVSLYYHLSKDLSMKLDWTHSNYLIHLPGQLTDSMFQADPQMSTRSRNYYSPSIHVPSLTVDWQLAENTKLEFIASAVLGVRNSIMFDKPATIEDTIVTATLAYNTRQIDIDNYSSRNVEVRLLQSYKLLGQTSTLSSGIQYMNNDMHRRQQGVGSTGTDYDLTLVTPGWGRDLYYKTNNIALYAENRWALTPRFSVNTGARVEMGASDMTGEIVYYEDSLLPTTIEHKFPLFGAGMQYNISRYMNIYGGFSQAYRPVIFKDIVPAATYEIIDNDLEDAYGYNAEIGFRGTWEFLRWDVTGFLLQYNNRMGSIAETDTAGNLTIYKTNIGNSQTKGLEMFVQGDFYLNDKSTLSVFTSTSYMDAKYQDAVIKVGTENVDIDGNKVESVPEWISRNGFTYTYTRFSFSGIYSYTSESFADALNTVEPNASGSVGIVPAYGITDANMSVRLSPMVKLQLNANNIFDVSYFTKRPQFYPGPGIWPSDGRTFSLTVKLSV